MRLIDQVSIKVSMKVSMKKLVVPQSHSPRHPADESKLGDVEGGRPSVVIVKNRLGISVVVMQ